MISEQPTEENIQQLIDEIPTRPTINALERIILCHDGTVQTLLSVLFGVPAKVVVLSQQTLPDIGILRWTKLVVQYQASDQEIVACLAESFIPFKNNPEGFITAIQEKKMGVGQILKATGLKQERHVFGLYVDENVIARNYCIKGDVDIIITETFPREAIRRGGG